MITVNPVKFNSNRPISFGQNDIHHTAPGKGIMLVQSDASQIKFEKDNFARNFELTQKSDMVRNNLITAAIAKGRKTINILFNQQPNPNKVDENYRHIVYSA